MVDSIKTTPPHRVQRSTASLRMPYGRRGSSFKVRSVGCFTRGELSYAGDTLINTLGTEQDDNAGRGKAKQVPGPPLMILPSMHGQDVDNKRMYNCRYGTAVV